MTTAFDRESLVEFGLAQRIHALVFDESCTRGSLKNSERVDPLHCGSRGRYHAAPDRLAELIQSEVMRCKNCP